MANSIWNFAMNGNTSDAAYRTTISNFAAQLTAIGLVQTSDTGQVNLATATRPFAGSDGTNWQVWRFDDAAQATCPIFFKFWFGSAVAGQIYPRFRMDIGRGTDGAGNLTPLGRVGVAGGISTLQWVFLSSGSSVTANMNFSGDGSGFAVCLPDPGTVNDQFFMFVDRFRDASGNPTDKGLVASVKTTQTATPTTIVWDAARNRFGSMSRGVCVIPATWTAGNAWLMPSGDPAAFGGSVSVPEQYHVKMQLVYNTADIAQNTLSDITHLGAERTYKAWGTKFQNCDHIAQAFAGALQWWED